MKESTAGYYFRHIDEFPLPGLLRETASPAELFEGLKAFCDGALIEWAKKRGEDAPAGVTVIGDVHIQPGVRIFPGVVIQGPAVICAGAEIKANAVIEGPVYVGEGCSIAAHAYLRPYTVLGKKAGVGHASEVKCCLVQNGAKIASLAFAGDSILGKGARVGSGTILANRRCDQSNARVKILGELIDLGRDFFGCVLGDYCRLGANCVTLPGAHIGPFCRVMPQTVVRVFVPEATAVTATQQLESRSIPPVALK
jgi:NDP-sugar pyrophosphorylase family protein